MKRFSCIIICFVLLAMQLLVCNVTVLASDSARVEFSGLPLKTVNGSNQLEVKMKMYNTKFNTIQFTIGFDPSKIQIADPVNNTPVDNLSSGTTFLSPLYKVLDNSGWVSITYQKVDNTKGIAEYTLSVDPSSWNATNGADPEGFVTAGSDGLDILKLHFKVLDSTNLNNSSIVLLSQSTKDSRVNPANPTGIIVSDYSGNDITASNIVSVNLSSISDKLYTIKGMCSSASNSLETGIDSIDDDLNTKWVTTVRLKSSYLSPNIISSTYIDAANKTFSFGNISAGTYILEIKRNGFLTRYVPVVITNQDVDIGDKPCYAGDLNNDGIIDNNDLQLLFSKISCNYGDNDYIAEYDLCPDGNLDYSDVQIIYNNWNYSVSTYGEKIDFTK